MGHRSFSFIPFLNLFYVTFGKVSSCFPGKMSYLPTADPENPEEFFEGLSCGEVSILGNFSLSSDDPRNYNDKIPLISQNRQFPDEAYPAGADPDLLHLKLLQFLHQQANHLLLQVELLNPSLVWILLFNSFMKH